MRLDYLLYAVAIVCFLLAAVFAALSLPVHPYSTIIMAVLGLIFASAGYLKKTEN